MDMAEALQTYLQRREVAFEIFSYGPGGRPADVARALGFALDQIARPIFLHDRRGLIMAVIPSNRRLNLTALRQFTGRPQLTPAPTDTVAQALVNCEPTAAPPFSELYDLETVVEEAFADMDGIYFVACRTGILARVQSDAFQRLHAASEWATIATPAPPLRVPTRHPRALLPRQLAGRFHMPRPTPHRHDS